MRRTIVVGSRGLATFATTVRTVAIDDLLRSEVQSVGGRFAGQNPSGLNSLSCGEGPAAVA
jgi:hypothetical protein